jgi:class 3 adenylate cyclase
MAAAPRSEEWRVILTEGHGRLVRARHLFRLLPSDPRCKVCNNPFGGVGGRVVGLAGWKPSRKNPNLCARCCDALPVGGADVDVALLFADVRGSTALGEGAAPAAYAGVLNRFYAAATDALLRHDAIIDKLIGDEVMAIFVRGVSGPGYRARAVEAGLDLLRAVGYGTPGGPWLDLGVAVHAGVAYVGNVGSAVVDFTALGDPVNVAARLQGHAAAGELLVADGVDDERVAGRAREHRTLALRGRDAAIGASVLTV